MAVDYFMKLADIDGESADSKHSKEIDVLAWSWGMSNAGSAHSSSGMGTGKVNVQDLSFTHYVDVASTKLMNSCATGDHIDSAILTCRKAGGKDPLEYLKVTLTSVFVTSLSTGGSQGDERQTENVTLNFAKVKVEYFTQDDKGGGKPAGNFTRNIPANTQ